MVATRTIPKLFFGVSAFMKVVDTLDFFEHTYGFLLGRVNDKGKFILGKSWYCWSGLDDVNRRLAMVTSKMAKGMVLELCIC